MASVCFRWLAPFSLDSSLLVAVFGLFMLFILLKIWLCLSLSLCLSLHSDIFNSMPELSDTCQFKNSFDLPLLVSTLPQFLLLLRFSNPPVSQEPLCAFTTYVCCFLFMSVLSLFISLFIRSSGTNSEWNGKNKISGNTVSFFYFFYFILFNIIRWNLFVLQ